MYIGRGALIHARVAVLVEALDGEAVATDADHPGDVGDGLAILVPRVGWPGAAVGLAVPDELRTHVHMLVSQVVGEKRLSWKKKKEERILF